MPVGLAFRYRGFECITIWCGLSACFINVTCKCYICMQLCDACLAADTDNDGVGCDNMTCIIIFLAQT